MSCGSSRTRRAESLTTAQDDRRHGGEKGEEFPVASWEVHRKQPSMKECAHLFGCSPDARSACLNPQTPFVERGWNNPSLRLQTQLIQRRDSATTLMANAKCVLLMGGWCWETLEDNNGSRWTVSGGRVKEHKRASDALTTAVRMPFQPAT